MAEHQRAHGRVVMTWGWMLYGQALTFLFGLEIGVMIALICCQYR